MLFLSLHTTELVMVLGVYERRTHIQLAFLRKRVACQKTIPQNNLVTKERGNKYGLKGGVLKCKW